MAQYIAEPARVFAVARDAQQLAGFISLKDGSRISQLFVAPAFQGRGLGRRLWNQVRVLAGAQEGAAFTVDASLNAVAVYSRFGFVPCGPVTRDGGVVFLPMHRPAA